MGAAVVGGTENSPSVESSCLFSNFGALLCRGWGGLGNAEVKEQAAPCAGSGKLQWECLAGGCWVVPQRESLPMRKLQVSLGISQRSIIQGSTEPASLPLPEKGLI